MWWQAGSVLKRPIFTYATLSAPTALIIPKQSLNACGATPWETYFDPASRRWVLVPHHQQIIYLFQQSGDYICSVDTSELDIPEIRLIIRPICDGTLEMDFGGKLLYISNICSCAAVLMCIPTKNSLEAITSMLYALEGNKCPPRFIFPKNHIFQERHVQLTERHTQVYGVTAQGLRALKRVAMPLATLAGRYFPCAHMHFVVLESRTSQQLHYLNLSTLKLISGPTVPSLRRNICSTVNAECGVHVLVYAEAEVTVEVYSMHTGKLMRCWKEVILPASLNSDMAHIVRLIGVQIHVDQLLIRTSDHLFLLHGVDVPSVVKETGV